MFFVLPMAGFLRASLYPSIGPAQQGTTITAENYAAALSDEFLRTALLNTLKLSLIIAVLGTALAYPIAYTAARARLWGRLLFVIVVTVMFTSAVPRAMGWAALLSSGAVFEVNDGFTAVVIGTLHAVLPLAVIGLLPVCESVPRSLLEAARGLGASNWSIFWKIIVPHTEGGLVAVALLLFAVTAGAFTTPALLGRGGVALLSVLIRQEVLQILDWGRGTTYAVILLAMVALVGLVTAFVSYRRQSGHRSLGQVAV